MSKVALFVLGLTLTARLAPTALCDCIVPSSECQENMTIVCRTSLQANDYLCYHYTYIRWFNIKLDPDTSYVDQNPGTLENSVRIATIDASQNIMDYIPAVVFTWKSLGRANFSNNRIRSLNFAHYIKFENLEYLDLSFNYIDVIHLPPDDVTMNVYSTLKYLSLRNNLIEFIPERMFEKFKRVQTLEFSHNNIKTIDSSTFDGLETIIKIDLSFNKISSLHLAVMKCKTLNELFLDNNELSELTHYDFESLYQLKKLTLNNNNIVTLAPDLFASLENLNQLFLNNNSLVEFSKSSKVYSARRLNVLDLSNNFISFMEPGSFANNSEVTTLNLEGNRLEGTLQKHQFLGLSHIKLLNLSHHKLSEIEEFAFSGMDLLTVLDISNNNLSSLAKEAFRYLNNLKKLDLSNNSLTQTKFDAEDLVSLSWLSIKNNRLSELSHQLFAQLKALQYLDISSNNIAHINSEAFNSMINLNEFYFGNNPLSGIIERYAFANLSSVPELDFSHSHLVGISNDSFSKMISLKFLNFSCSNFARIEYEAFRDTKILRVIDLSHNRLNQFLVNTSNLLRLEELNLAHNNIAHITPLTFDKLSSLNILNLAYNNLSSINESTFVTLTNLTFLDASFNIHAKVNLIFLQGLENLTYLSLSKISAVYGFSNFTKTNLKTLELTCSHISNLDSLFSRSFSSIERLSLDRNEIRSIHKNSFSELSYLLVLDLHSNNISELTPGTFKNTQALMSLDLSHNLMNTVSYGLLLGLRNLETLNLSFNKIFQLDVHTLSYSPLLSTLIIDGNMLTDINLYEFSKASISTISLGDNPLKCKAIAAYKRNISIDNSYRLIKVTALTFDYHHENVDGITCLGGSDYSTGKTQNSSTNIEDNLSITNNLLKDIKTILGRKELQNQTLTKNEDSNFIKKLMHNMTHIADDLEKIQHSLYDYDKPNGSFWNKYEHMLNMMQKDSALHEKLYTELEKENDNINKLIQINLSQQDNFVPASIESELNSNVNREQNLTAHYERIKSIKEITEPSNVIGIFTLVVISLILATLMGVAFAMYKSSGSTFYKLREGLEFNSL